MSWEHRGELRADPGTAPGDRGIEVRPRRSVWPSIAVVAAAAAFGGVIWFAYQNGKDANKSGTPPLVKADPSPVKVKPTDPGGQEIPFQDSTVYDRLDQKGQKPVMEKLLPPPEQPVSRPQAVMQAPPATPDVSAGNQAAASAPPVADTTSPTALAPLPGAAIITQSPATALKPAQVAAVPAPPVTAPPKPAASPKSAPPPTSIAGLLAEMPAKSAPAGSATNGSYRIQLSAVRSQDAVAPEWARLKHRFPETLGTLSVITSKTNVQGKGDFYRLRAGPLDQAGAKSACGHLRTQGLDCIVVKP